MYKYMYMKYTNKFHRQALDIIMIVTNLLGQHYGDGWRCLWFPRGKDCYGVLDQVGDVLVSYIQFYITTVVSIAGREGWKNRVLRS